MASLEGDFNMLRAVVCYLRQFQDGVGISAVSNQYAASLELTLPLLWGLRIDGHPNPTLDSDKPSLPEGVSLVEHKAVCKKRMQAALGLKMDPDAVMLGFVGRLTYEKGVDLVMDAAFWLLSEFPHVQMFIVGPIGDEVGQHVSTRLQLGAQVASIRERMFVATTFFPVTADMRYGTDFALCPSRVEPFGYVDVEFAWHGAPTVGALVGGLGKVPGVYYRVLEPGDRHHLLHQLKTAIHVALAMSPAQRLKAGEAGLTTSFPYPAWSEALEAQYERVCAASVGRRSTREAMRGEEQHEDDGSWAGSRRVVESLLSQPRALTTQLHGFRPLQMLSRAGESGEESTEAQGSLLGSSARSESFEHLTPSNPPSNPLLSAEMHAGSDTVDAAVLTVTPSTTATSKPDTTAGAADGIASTATAAASTSAATATGAPVPPLSAAAAAAAAAAVAAPVLLSNRTVSPPSELQLHLVDPTSVGGDLDPDVLKLAVQAETIAAIFLAPPKTVPKDLDDIIADAHEKASLLLSHLTPSCTSVSAISCFLLREKLFSVTYANWVIILLRILAPETPVASVATLSLGNVRFAAAETMFFFSVQAIARGLSSYVWMRLARLVPIPKLLAAAGFFQLANAAPLLQAYKTSKAVVLAASVLSGIAQGAIEPLLIGFSFLDQWAGHVTVAAQRAAIIEPARIAVSLSLCGLIIARDKCASDGCDDYGYLDTAASFGFGIAVTAQLLLALICLSLPIKHSLRLPDIRLRGPSATQAPSCLRSFVLLVLSDIIDGA